MIRFRWMIWRMFPATRKSCKFFEGPRKGAFFLLHPPAAFRKHRPSQRPTLAVVGNGVIAQMGERLNGIQEVGSSILPGSTN